MWTSRVLTRCIRIPTAWRAATTPRRGVTAIVRPLVVVALQPTHRSVAPACAPTTQHRTLLHQWLGACSATIRTISSTTTSRSGADVYSDTFEQLGVSRELSAALAKRAISRPFEVQQRTIPLALHGIDLAVRAVTGSGKTLCFVIPIAMRISQHHRHAAAEEASNSQQPQSQPHQAPPSSSAAIVSPQPSKLSSRAIRNVLAGGVSSIHHSASSSIEMPGVCAPMALVLAPTRELCVQSCSEMRKALEIEAPLAHCSAIYGGVPYDKQESELRDRRPAVVVGSPGRVFDWVQRGVLSLRRVEMLVLDEADRMLESGAFDGQVTQLVHLLPLERRQTLLFSATFSPGVREWVASNMAASTIEIDSVGAASSSIPSNIEHCCMPLPPNHSNAIRVLSDLLTIHSSDKRRTIIFARTKAVVESIAQELHQRRFAVQLLHADLTQAERERNLSQFRSGSISVLVASDIAGRGLDVPECELVIHLRPPMNTDVYVHRSGRTGRAGRSGKSILLYSPQEDGGFLSRLRKIHNVPMPEVPLPDAGQVVDALLQRVAQDVAHSTAEIHLDRVPKPLVGLCAQMNDSHGTMPTIVALTSMVLGLLRPRQSPLLAVTDKQRKEQQEERRKERRLERLQEKKLRAKKKEKKAAKKIRNLLRGTADDANNNNSGGGNGDSPA